MKPFRIVILLVLGAIGLAWGADRIAPSEAAASRAFQSGQREAAAGYYIDSAVHEPDSSERLYSAGSAQLGLDNEEAASMLKRVYDSGGESLKNSAAYNAGIAYFQAGDYHQAVLAFRAVLRRDPNDADARYNYELALRYDLPPTPSEQQQQTNPEDGQTDPTVTPSPQPGGFDGPTPTPPREEQVPDPSRTPVSGTGDFGDDADSTPVPSEGGPLTLEEAMRLLDAAAQDALTIAPFYSTPVPGGETGENDW